MQPRAARTTVIASPKTLDLNASLRRLERRIRRAIGPRIALNLQLAADLAPAREQRVPLDRIILSLVQNAADAMPEGGTLTLATGNLALASGAPDAPSPSAPDRYVTLRVSDTGPGLDIDGLSQAFGAQRGRAPWPEAVIHSERISVAAIHRILQRCGADLSAEIEAGRGSIFTVFLPASDGDKLDAETSGTAAPLRAASPAP
jgi:signal transduction histidine kinase